MNLNAHSFLKFIIIVVSIGFYSCKKPDKKPTELTNKDNNLNSVEINSEKLHYIKKGKGEPIIFVHGTISDYRTWNRQIDTFSTQYEVLAYSRRYAYPNKQVFDESFDYSPKIHSDDLTILIDSLKYDKVNLIGHSYGAYTALLTAIQNPSKIKSLTLGEPPIIPMLRGKPIGDSLYNELIIKAFEPSNAAFNRGDDSGGVAAFVGGVMGDSTVFYKVPPEGRKPWLNNTLELRGSVLHQEFTKIDTLKLKKLNIPVLLIKGEFSPPMFSIIIDELHRHLPNSKVYTLANSSHGLQGENPTDFNREVFSFLKK